MKEVEALLPAIQTILTNAQKILIIVHVGPDGDAIGSLTAMGQVLKQMGKEVILACDDPSPPEFEYLPLFADIMQPDDANLWQPDLVVALDCGDAERMGHSFAGLKGEISCQAPEPAILNIDHHRTNTRFGKVNLVVPQATATTEILYHLFLAMGVEITVDLAVSLLTGLVTDTLCFRISSVTAETVRVGSALMEAGANLSEITDRAMNVKPFSTLKLFQKGLNNMKFEDGFLWTTISNEERLEAGHEGSGSAGMVTMFGNSQSAAMGCVMIQVCQTPGMDAGTVYVGFRCRPPWDVSALATGLGGGGHQFASGCSLDMPLAEAESLVVTQAKAEIERQQSNQ